MKWDAVVKAMRTALLADAQLVAALGTDGNGNAPIYPASASRPVHVPSVEYFMVFDRERESLNPIMIQIDYFARGIAKAAIIERRIRSVLHRDRRRTFAGSDCATLYEDGRDHDYPETGVVHRSLDFRFEPVREKYDT